MSGVDTGSQAASVRALFSIPDDVVYLNCANMSPQLRAVSAAGQRAVLAKEAPWTIQSKDWFAPSEQLRGVASRILNASVDDIALVPAASYGIAIAAANVNVNQKQFIVILDQEFPSNVYAWRALAARSDCGIRTIRREAAASWTQCLIAAIDESTAVVAVPNCHWTDGTLVDLEAVGVKCRSVGAALVVDASQSLGALSLDVEKVRPDFVVSVGYKWLMGPYGLGYLYVAPWRRGGEPLEHSWLARAGSEDFSRLVHYSDALQPGARRFDMGGFPQFVLTPMATCALLQVLEWGVENIAERLGGLTEYIRKHVQTLQGWTVPDALGSRHMTAAIRVGGIPERLPTALARRKIHVSVRGDRIRISPHLYNSIADLDVLLEVIADY